ncbi:hypothetical protein ACP275_07G057200 [Erythranthe tilingii]
MASLIIQETRCVGSSHGWLIFLDEISNPFLFNPFSRTKIRLPEKHTLPIIPQVQIVRGLISNNSNPTINKVVLCGNPSLDKNDYAVIVMYSTSCPGQTKIAFCMHGDVAWRNLEGELETYYDVVCHDGTKTMYALGPGPTVEVWDLNERAAPKKKVLEGSCPGKLGQVSHVEYPSDLYTSRWYLALSPSGGQPHEIFLAVRYVGEFVRYDGEVVYEGDTLTDYAAEPLVCPYKTFAFDVFKLESGSKEWIDVECLGDFAMLLGGNHSMVIPTKESTKFERSSIYFTDDYWDRMEEDYCYGGHDNGVYNMEDGKIEPLVENQQDRIVPPPFWIVN